MGVNARTGALGVQSLHHCLCEFHLPTFSKVVKSLKEHPIVFPIGDPTSREVRSTRMTSHCRGLFLPEAMRPFFKSPCITVLPGEGGAVDKVEHGRDTNSFVGFEPMQKGSFEHRMNAKGKDTLLNRHTDKGFGPSQ